MRKIVFLGSKPIGYKCLEFLLKNQEKFNCKVVAVLSNDNIRFGTEYSVKQLTAQNQLRFVETLEELMTLGEEIDFLISVQYHLILKQRHIDLAKVLAVNLHMAPLPEYRGCNQFSFAIYNKSKIFGTTLHQLEAGIDDGKIIAERRFDITPDMMVKDLYDKTISESILLFEEHIGLILNKQYTLVPQETLIEKRGTKTYYRKDISKLKQIDLGASADEVIRKVKATAMPGFEPPYTIIDNVKYYIVPEKNYAK